MQIDHYQRIRERDAIMRDPNTADNMDVRKAILSRVRAGEITLAQGQSELAAIQLKAKKNGQQTAYGKAKTHCHCGKQLNEAGLCWCCDPISTCWPQ